MKKLKSVLVLLLLVVAIILVAVAGFRYFTLTCEEVKVVIVDKNKNTMVTEQQACQLILKSPANPVGKKVRKYDRKGIEQAVKQNPWVSGVRSITVNGSSLTVAVETQSPIAFLFPEGSSPLLLTSKGQLLPDDSRCSDLLIVNGSVGQCEPNTSVHQSASLNNAYAVAKVIADNSNYAAQYPEIFVRPDGQIELYSVLGGHTILLGNAANISDKLANLDAAYSQGLLDVAPYKSLDLRFQNRIYAVK